jgi:uncharacterized protein YjbI with pentapeptide repeats
MNTAHACLAATPDDITKRPQDAPFLPEAIREQRYQSPPMGADMADKVFIDCHFDHVDWTGCRLSNVRFVNCNVVGNRYTECEIDRVTYESSRLDNAIWSDCRMRETLISECQLGPCTWVGGSVRESICANSKGSNWTFDTVRVAHFSVIACELESLSVQSSTWSDTSWIKCRLKDMAIAKTQLDNLIVGQSEGSGITIDRCQGINMRWIDTAIVGMIISDCVFDQAAWSHSRWTQGQVRNCRFPKASFDNAALDGISIKDSDLNQAMFDNARLQACNLERLNAPRLSLRDASLTNVNLAGAHLPQLDARGVQLDKVALRGADCSRANLAGQDARVWASADTPRAVFTSSIGHDEKLWLQRNRPGARIHDDLAKFR